MYDLFDYLTNEYLKSHDKSAVDQSIQMFIEFARTQLKSNPPVGLDYKMQGFGLIMANNDRVSVVKDSEPNAMYAEDQLHEPGISVTSRNY
jgi:hypothetical protein